MAAHCRAVSGGAGYHRRQTHDPAATSPSRCAGSSLSAPGGGEGWGEVGRVADFACAGQRSRGGWRETLMPADFVHLRAHSAYSLSAGAIKVKELVGLAKKHGMPALALTDAGNLFGALEFAQAATDSGGEIGFVS